MVHEQQLGYRSQPTNSILICLVCSCLGNIISESKFAELIANAPVLEYGKGSNEGVFELFKRGTPSTNCIVIMSGKVKISAGREGKGFNVV